MCFILKGLCLQLSMRILGAKFKFFVGHRKIQLSAILCRDSVILSNSYCFFCHRDNNRSRLEKVPRLDYSLKTFCIFRPLREKMASRKTEVRGLVGRPMLSSEPALFLRLCWGGWNFLVGLLGLVLPQIPAKKRHVVTSRPSWS